MRVRNGLGLHGELVSQILLCFVLWSLLQAMSHGQVTSQCD